MGRLTLNVLLSFAQFEREVIGERVRDKVAASKRKGMWMGGTVPLGYDVVERKLVINEGEAETVRHIFRRYLELGSVRELKAALALEGVRTKVQIMRDGGRRGGVPFARGPLYCVLKNPIYAGKIQHHKNVFSGQHEQLISAELWEDVQALLASNGATRRLGTNASEPSLLVGRFTDSTGRPMIASHASKRPRRYRYYLSAPAPEPSAGGALRLPVGEVEALVRRGLRELLADGAKLARDLATSGADQEVAGVIASCAEKARDVSAMPTSDLRQLLAGIDARVTVDGDGLAGTYMPARLAPD
jgi:hypothetical protein